MILAYTVTLSPRHEDLKQMLDSNKDGLKLEAMKRIIGVGVWEAATHLLCTTPEQHCTN